MARPDPALLDPARYPFHCTIETRFGDLDVNRHINNVAMSGLIEEGRVRFHRQIGLYAARDGLGTMAVSVAVEFLGQSHFPDPLDMHVALAHTGTTSYTLCQIAMQHGRTVAFARSVLVCMRDNESAPIPRAFLETADRWRLRQ